MEHGPTVLSIDNDPDVGDTMVRASERSRRIAAQAYFKPLWLDDPRRITNDPTQRRPGALWG